MSNEVFSTLRGTKFAFEIEATEGTAPTDDANDAILINEGGLALRLGREVIPRKLLHGSLSQLAPVMGKYSDDLGFDIQVEVKGSGTQNTAPEIGDLLAVLLGTENVGANGTVAASPSPSTSGLTITGGTFVAGQLARVEVTAGNFEISRILTLATGAATFFPYFSAAPGSTLAVQAGVTYTLLSSSFGSGSAFFYFDGGEKLILSGCKCTSAKLTMDVGQPMMLDMSFQALNYAFTHGTQGYTPTVNITTQPPVCLGMTVARYYDATVVTGSTTTSVILTATPDLEIAVGDTLIVYVAGSTSYETKTITGVSGAYGADKTLTVTALSGAPAASAQAYIKRTTTLETGASMGINISPEVTKTADLNNSYGSTAQRYTDREVTVDMSQYLKSAYEFDARNNLAAVELWGVLGSTAGNIIAWCLPNVIRQTTEIGIDRLLMNPVTAGAYMTSGNDEFYLGFL